MARIFMGGNEFGDYHVDGWQELAGYQPQPVINQGGGRRTPLGNGGNYYYYLPNGVFMSLPLPGGAHQEIYARMGMAFNGTNGAKNWLTFYHGSNLLYTLQNHDNGNPNMGFSILRSDDSVIANSPNVAPYNNGAYGWSGSFYLVEWHLKLGQAPSSNNLFEMWINGTLIISVPGLEDPLLEPSSAFDRISVGCFRNDNGQAMVLDDMALNDTSEAINNGRVGDGYIIPFAPNDNGTYSGLTNNLGSKTNNFKSVAGYPTPNGFVGTYPPLIAPPAGNQNQRDTYKMTPLPFELGGTTALQFAAYASHNGPGVQHLQFAMIPNNGSPEAEIDFPTAATVTNPGATSAGIPMPNGAFGWVREIIETNPNNSNNPFSVSEISNGEIGVTLNA